MRGHGIASVDEYIRRLEQYEIQNGLAKVFSYDKPPTALLAGNDLTLMEVLNYTKEKNIKIPDELALISIDDVSFAHIYSPSLTTIFQPAFDMGEGAAKLFIDKIMGTSDEGGDKVHRFKAKLMVSNSY